MEKWTTTPTQIIGWLRYTRCLCFKSFTMSSIDKHLLRQKRKYESDSKWEKWHTNRWIAGLIRTLTKKSCPSFGIKNNNCKCFFNYHWSVSSILRVMFVTLSPSLLITFITFFPERAAVWLDLGSSASSSRNSRKSGSVLRDGCTDTRERKRSKAARRRSKNWNKKGDKIIQREAGSEKSSKPRSSNPNLNLSSLSWTKINFSRKPS